MAKSSCRSHAPAFRSWLCTMKMRSKSPVVLLKLIYFTLLSVLEAQEVHVWPQVTGYLRHDVTLPCQFIQGPENISIVQVQWNLLSLTGEEIKILISDSQHGLNIPNSTLSERVEIAEQSLIIKDVEMRDAGSYICIVTTFPSGSLRGTTQLVVQEQIPLSLEVVSGIAIAVILLVGIMAAVAYFIFIKRRDSLIRHPVDTGGTEMDLARQSVVREKDVVYSDVRRKPSGDVTPSSNDKNTEATYNDVTYAEVVVWGQQPK
ncbi:nectin-3-like isoform X2 [Xiphias gladius]|uniref:nectin-3-like isoform X2 n=1 Tax=Xiphias gladius TaxID=8245 RepID=UPI001A9941D5|nr:nectin-3-like isoform X2 [Xiphias gladius]